MGAGRLLLLAIVGLGATNAAVAAEPVAVVTQVQGDARVQRADASSATDAAAGMALAAGDRLQLSAGANVTLLHRSGRVERVTTSMTVGSSPERRENGLFTRAMRTLSQVVSTDVRQQPNREGMIRPIPGAVVAIAPRNEVLVSGVHPTFTWTAVPGAEGYRVQLQLERGVPVRHAASRDTVWSLPATAPPLTPGAYSWTVAAEPRGRPAAPQRFRVATQAEVAALEASLGMIVAAGMDPQGDGLLLAAIAQREAGFLYEARGSLDRLDAFGAPIGREVLLLRAEILDELGDLEGAAAALARAGSAMSGG